MNNALYGIINGLLGAGRGYYGGLAERNRVQYGLGREAESDERSRQMYDWRRQQQEQDTKRFGWQEQDRERQAKARQEYPGLLNQLVTGGGGSTPNQLFPQFDAQQGITPNTVDPGVYGPTLPARGGLMPFNSAMSTILGADAEPETITNLMNTYMSANRFGHEDWRFGQEQGSAVDPALTKQALTQDLLQRIANGQDLQKTLGELKYVKLDSPYAGVKLGQITSIQQVNTLIAGGDPEAIGTARTAEAEAVPGDIKYRQGQQSYEESGRLPIATVLQQNKLLGQRADYNLNPVSSMPGASYLPENMQGLSIGVLPDIGAAQAGMGNVVRGTYETKTPEELAALPAKKIPATGLPTVAAGIRGGTDIARAGHEATTETRTGDSPDVFVNRTINALYDTYGDADKIPLAMLEKYKRRAKEMIDNNMFQWTPAERDQAFATLDKWALQFRQTKDTERRMKEEDEKQYQRDLARDKARSSGGGGSTTQYVTIPGGGPSGEDIRIPSSTYYGSKQGGGAKLTVGDKEQFTMLKSMTLPGSDFERWDYDTGQSAGMSDIQAEYIDPVTRAFKNGPGAAQLARNVLDEGLRLVQRGTLTMATLQEWWIGEYTRRAESGAVEAK